MFYFNYRCIFEYRKELTTILNLEIMTTTKRTYTETLQIREYAVKANGIGREWIPRIEKVYEFCSVEEFLKTFSPMKSSEGLINSITKAYNDCGEVKFNAGNGNQTFNFKK